MSRRTYSFPRYPERIYVRFEGFEVFPKANATDQPPIEYTILDWQTFSRRIKIAMRDFEF